MHRPAQLTSPCLHPSVRHRPASPCLNLVVRLPNDQHQQLGNGTAPGVAARAAAAAAPAPSNKGRLIAYFTLWYSFNVVFNIVNKATLNIFPMPWFLATWQLAASGLFMCFLWLTKIHPVPRLPRAFLKSLMPVAFFHTVGHAAACVSFSKMAVSFTHIIKASEPVLTVALSGALPFPLQCCYAQQPFITTLQCVVHTFDGVAHATPAQRRACTACHPRKRRSNGPPWRRASV